MSLTSELETTGSPIRLCVEAAAATVQEAKRGAPYEREAKSLLGLEALPPLALAPLPGANGGTVGSAFDYRLRFDLGWYSCTDTVAALGARLVPPAVHAGAFLEETDRVTAELAADRNPLDDAAELELTRRCVVLALLESVYRSGRSSHLLPWPADPLELAPSEVVADVTRLQHAARTGFGPVVERVRSGDRYLPNPTFAGSVDVKADADIIVGDELIELKTVKTLDGMALRAALNQLVGYCLLDYEDALAIRTVGVYFARHQLLRSWPLTSLVFPPDAVFGAAETPAEEHLLRRLGELRGSMRATTRRSR